MSVINYGQLLGLAWPEIIVALTALIVVALDIILFRRSGARIRFAAATTVGIAGCAGAIIRLLIPPTQATALAGVFVANPLTNLVQIALLALTIVTLLLSVESNFTEHVSEFVLLLLLATVGMMFLVGSQDLLVIFISLELLSLSLYILAGFDKRSPRSAEASLKYFLFGGMSAAFMLFGFSLLYGLSNSTSLAAIAQSIYGRPINPLLIIAIVTTVIGFGFKIAAAPFHFWAPDIYQGAPIPSAAFIASGSKVASFFIFFQILVLGFAGAEGSATFSHLQSGWVPVLIIVAAISMLWGNLVAIVQSSLRRLLAYSAVAHAGYMLLAFITHTQQSLAALLYYVATYSIATVGVLGVLAVTERQIGNDNISDLAGLSRRAPFLSVCLAIFLLSLAGIPPLSGFFAKFLLFTSVLAADPASKMLLWLVVTAIAMSAVSLFYYLRVLKKVFVSDSPCETQSIRSPILTRIVIGLLAGGVVLLGCMPDLLLNRILNVIQASGL